MAVGRIETAAEGVVARGRSDQRGTVEQGQFDRPRCPSQVAALQRSPILLRVRRARCWLGRLLSVRSLSRPHCEWLRRSARRPGAERGADAAERRAAQQRTATGDWMMIEAAGTSTTLWVKRDALGRRWIGGAARCSHSTSLSARLSVLTRRLFVFHPSRRPPSVTKCDLLRFARSPSATPPQRGSAQPPFQLCAGRPLRSHPPLPPAR